MNINDMINSTSLPLAIDETPPPFPKNTKPLKTVELAGAIVLGCIGFVVCVTILVSAWKYVAEYINDDSYIHVESTPQKCKKSMMPNQLEMGNGEGPLGSNRLPKYDSFDGGLKNNSTQSNPEPAKPHNRRTSSRVAHNGKDVSISHGILSKSSRRDQLSPQRCSLLTSSPERPRKDSGSSTSTPKLWFGSPDTTNISAELTKKRKSVENSTNNSLLSNDSIFSTPEAQMSCKRYMTARGCRQNSACSIAPLTHSPTTEMRPFYFSWPELDEEDHVTVWSPLVMKLAAIDVPKVDVMTEDQKVLRKAMKAHIQENELARMKLDRMVQENQGKVSVRSNAYIPAGIKNTWV